MTDSKESGQTESFSQEELTEHLQQGILNGEMQVKCTYEGSVEQLSDQVDAALENCLTEDYLCQNLLDNIEVEWNEDGPNIDGTFTLVYKEDVYPPVVTAPDETKIVEALIAGWQAGQEKVTIVLEQQSYQEEQLFAMLDGAEINSAGLTCEADSVYYEIYEPEGELQIIKMWLDFGTDIEALQEQQEELNRCIQEYGEALKDEECGQEEIYRRIYEKVLELAEYDDTIAVVTDMERLGVDTRVLRSAYGALVDGHTVCTGYARGYKALCDYLGMPCRVVVGIRDGINHAWNCVRLDGELLYVDCTTGDTGSAEEDACLFTQEQMENSGYIMGDSYILPEI